MAYVLVGTSTNTPPASITLYSIAAVAFPAGNELAKVSVSQDYVSLNGIGKSQSEPVSDPLKQVEKLLESLPIENWTAYGYVAFDIARFYSSYSKAIQQELLYFLIPETELRFTEEGVYIRSINSLEQVRKLLFMIVNCQIM
jgi:salicylate synthetase